MNRLVVVMVGLAVSVGAATAAPAAERKPIEQLPGDVVRWSTTWMEVPKQMTEVSREEGPLSGLVWGPAKGTALMFRATTEALWELAQPDEQPVARGRDREPGMILRYEF